MRWLPVFQPPSGDTLFDDKGYWDVSSIVGRGGFICALVTTSWGIIHAHPCAHPCLRCYHSVDFRHCKSQWLWLTCSSYSKACICMYRICICTYMLQCKYMYIHWSPRQLFFFSWGKRVVFGCRCLDLPCLYDWLCMCLNHLFMQQWYRHVFIHLFPHQFIPPPPSPPAPRWCRWLSPSWEGWGGGGGGRDRTAATQTYSNHQWLLLPKCCWKQGRDTDMRRARGEEMGGRGERVVNDRIFKIVGNTIYHYFKWTI